MLEANEVANSWKKQRWDSFSLLTPNWQTTLPGLSYDGDEPDGFMTARDIANFIDRYAGAVDAPVETATTVRPDERRETARTCRGAVSSGNTALD